jgi:hypothetical protein
MRGLCRPFRAGVPGVAYPGRRPSQARDLPWAIVVRPVGARGRRAVRRREGLLRGAFLLVLSLSDIVRSLSS